jgi:predicted HAD superfamily Cof-like phosphohydrolase
MINWQKDIGATERNDEMIIKHVGYVLEECAEIIKALGLPGHAAVTIESLRLKCWKDSSMAQPIPKEALIEAVDGFSDIGVFAVAGLVRCGVDPIAALEEVQSSNDSKRLEDGTFMRDGNGKIMKPKHYVAPDFVKSGVVK